MICFHLWCPKIQSHIPSHVPAPYPSYTESLFGSESLSGPSRANYIPVLTCCQVFPSGHLVWEVFSVYLKWLCIVDWSFTTSPIHQFLDQSILILLSSLFSDAFSTPSLIAVAESWIPQILCLYPSSSSFLNLKFSESWKISLTVWCYFTSLYVFLYRLYLSEKYLDSWSSTNVFLIPLSCLYIETLEICLSLKFFIERTLLWKIGPKSFVL